jgi:hypothetical protein
MLQRTTEVFQLLVAANVVTSVLILFTQMMEVIHSSEMSVLTRVTCRHIPEDGILQVRLMLVTFFSYSTHIFPQQSNQFWGKWAT